MLQRGRWLNQQGEELTGLEELLLGSLRGALGDEEVKEWGRIYRESVTARAVRDVPALTQAPGTQAALPPTSGVGLRLFQHRPRHVTVLGTPSDVASVPDHHSHGALADWQFGAVGGPSRRGRAGDLR
ncbi:hypothetical protein [Streptomyces sp. Mg1]|uniref:hypothetical protein n=1 Tax=Streptomyces sp. Mg1 TaxID=465541 RepID=UPI00017EA00B|nr:hypothetical protein [Streptomyces sp. Mg1]EDX20672.1 hypothetical protein SSAG_00463 [Streptomyces sp. Mg1]